VTRDNVSSLNKEYIIHLDIERELLADTFTTFDLVYSKGVPQFGQLFVDTKLPWMFGDNQVAAGGREKKKTSMVHRLKDSYDRYKARKPKEK
jgi:hypothetical protein